jgi:multiple sugar transport system permease protein
MSFTDWNIMSVPRWVGFSNYAELFSDPAFYEILKNTFEFSLIYVSGVMVFGLLLAVLVNSKVKGVRFFRTSFFTPVVTSAVAVGIVWGWILSPKYGVLNYILENWFHITPPSWLGDAKWALPTVAFVQTWKMMGYYMIIFLAGLQSIPQQLYEAARIDGASRSQAFWRITLPLLSPTTFFAFTIAIIDSFRNFSIIYTMTQGGPQFASTTLVYAIYLNAFVFYRMGYASAMAYVLLLIVALITFVNFLLKKYWVQRVY